MTSPSKFSYVQTQGVPELPANSFVVISNKVYLDCSVLIGEIVSSLDSDRLPEVCFKLHTGLSKVQEIYNATKPTGQRFNIWNSPTFGSSQYYSNITPNGWYATASCQSNFFVKTDIDEIIAPLA